MNFAITQKQSFPKCFISRIIFSCKNETEKEAELNTCNLGLLINRCTKVQNVLEDHRQCAKQASLYVQMMCDAIMVSERGKRLTVKLKYKGGGGEDDYLIEDTEQYPIAGPCQGS